MSKLPRPSSSAGARGFTNTANMPEAGSELDLNALIVEVDLDALIGDLEKSTDDHRPHPPVPQPPSEDAEVPMVERRRSARLVTSELGDDLQVSIPRAARTTVVNVSRNGVLIETTCQLAPGSTTDLFVKFGGRRQALRATVVRSSLHSLAPEVVYRSALHFERILELGTPSGG